MKYEASLFLEPMDDFCFNKIMKITHDKINPNILKLDDKIKTYNNIIDYFLSHDDDRILTLFNMDQTKIKKILNDFNINKIKLNKIIDMNEQKNETEKVFDIEGIKHKNTIDVVKTFEESERERKERIKKYIKEIGRASCRERV